VSILKAEHFMGVDRWHPSSPWDRNRMEHGGLKTLLVGAGAAARTVARDLRRSPDYGLRLIGCLDDDPRLRSVLGVPLLGRLADLTRIVGERDVEAIVIAIPSLPPARLSELVRQATNTGAHVRFLPSFLSALSEQHAPQICASSISIACSAVGSTVGRSQPHGPLSRGNVSL
jgi:FlaA1/EpsC-like NDP-sugar epimerase